MRRCSTSHDPLEYAIKKLRIEEKLLNAGGNKRKKSNETKCERRIRRFPAMRVALRQQMNKTEDKLLMTQMKDLIRVID